MGAFSRGFSKVEKMAEDSFVEFFTYQFNLESSNIFSRYSLPTIGRAYDSYGSMVLPHVIINAKKCQPATPDSREELYRVEVDTIIRTSIREDSGKNSINLYSAFIRFLLADRKLLDYLNNEIAGLGDNRLIFNSRTDRYDNLIFSAREQNAEDCVYKKAGNYHQITFTNVYIIGSETVVGGANAVPIGNRRGYAKVETMAETSFEKLIEDSVYYENLSSSGIFYGKTLPAVGKAYESGSSIQFPHIVVYCKSIKDAYLDFSFQGQIVDIEVIVRSSIRDSKEDLYLISGFVRYVLADEYLASELNSSSSANGYIYFSGKDSNADLVFQRVRAGALLDEEFSTYIAHKHYHQITHTTSCVISS
jgi:hypothetical protein